MYVFVGDAGGWVMQKKKWCKPQLVVLFKGKPEEAVLSACKCIGGNIAGPYWADPGRNCNQSWTPCSGCTPS